MSEHPFLAAAREAMGTARPAPAGGDYTPRTDFAGDITPYALAALTRETAAVAAAPEGTRNDTLNKAALKLGTLVAGGELPPGLVWQELYNAALAAGLEQTETRATLNSGLRKGEQTPRTKPDTDKETQAWLNMHAAGPAPLPESANGSTPGQPHPQTVPGPQNGTQAPAPWETAPSPSTPAPAELPWEKSATTPPPGPAAAPAGPAPAEQGKYALTAEQQQQQQQLAQQRLNTETALELLRLQARAEAARIYARQHAPVTTPPLRSLTALLAEPDELTEYRVHGLLPAGGRIVVAAQAKAGKSTMTMNLVRALADGQPFLGRYKVEPATRITVIDDELNTNTIRRWYRDLEIQNTDAVRIVPMRGALNSFDIVDPVIRAEWAARLAGTEILILDCLRPVMDAIGLSEDKDAGKFLVAFDALMAECGATEAIVVHHMGHSGERARGDSRILDWPDAIWNLTREESQDSKSPRYFSAHGRDVDEPEQLLCYDHDAGRSLWLDGGSRQQVRELQMEQARRERREAAKKTIVEFVLQNPDVSGTGLQAALGGNKSMNAELLREAVSEGQLSQKPGRNGGYAYGPPRIKFAPPGQTRTKPGPNPDQTAIGPSPLDPDQDPPKGWGLGPSR